MSNLIPPAWEVISLIVISVLGGVFNFFRSLVSSSVEESARPGVVFVFSRRMRVKRTLVRFVVTVGFSFGAGFTGGMAVYGAGYSTYWAWAAAGFAGFMGREFFLLAREIIKSRFTEN